MDLLVETHGLALRKLAYALHEHFGGLELAARRARTKHGMPDKMYKRLVKMDNAFAIMRHITSPMCKSFLNELDDFCAWHGAGERDAHLLPVVCDDVDVSSDPLSALSDASEQASTDDTNEKQAVFDGDGEHGDSTLPAPHVSIFIGERSVETQTELNLFEVDSATMSQCVVNVALMTLKEKALQRTAEIEQLLHKVSWRLPSVGTWTLHQPEVFSGMSNTINDSGLVRASDDNQFVWLEKWKIGYDLLRQNAAAANIQLQWSRRLSCLRQHDPESDDGLCMLCRDPSRTVATCEECGWCLACGSCECHVQILCNIRLRETNRNKKLVRRMDPRFADVLRVPAREHGSSLQPFSQF